MPTLANYHHFTGRHWETGSVHNYYAYSGCKAPHTGQPYSEALLLGISGGITLGYFSFAYDGYDPHVALLTRNTFDPLNTLLARLGVVQEVRQTSNPAKALTNLLDTLADGLPALVWADMWSLPYNALTYDAGMWGMMPVLVYGYETPSDQVWIADRANVPLIITPRELAAARGRVKQDKFRLLTLDQPVPEKLAPAVTAGIWDCIKLYTEKPPKGSANNFGLKAFRAWADRLTHPKLRMSWAKEFPPGVKLYAGLTSTFSHYGATGINGDADRLLYAEFLAEAAIILGKPALYEVAAMFRQSSQAWQALGSLLLPDAVAAFGETRRLLTQRRHLFITQGGAALPQLQQIDERLQTIRATLAADFPLSDAEAVTQCAAISTQLLQIRDLEQAAIYALRASMA